MDPAVPGRLLSWWFFLATPALLSAVEFRGVLAMSHVLAAAELVGTVDPSSDGVFVLSPSLPESLSPRGLVATSGGVLSTTRVSAPPIKVVPVLVPSSLIFWA